MYQTRFSLVKRVKSLIIKIRENFQLGVVQYFHHGNHTNIGEFYDYSCNQYTQNVFLSHMQRKSSY